MTKRHLAIAFVVLIAFVTAGNAYLAIRATNRLGDVVSHELVNRVRNVEHWCSGINGTREIMRIVLNHFHVHIAIPNLDCGKIVALTRASASGL